MQGPLWLERGVSNKLVGPTALASQCTKTFELFHCISFDEGTVYLAASPALECYDARWWAFAPLGVAGLAVYVMGIPAAVAVFLHANQKQLGSPSFKRRYGALYLVYREDMYWWEVYLKASERLCVTVSLIVSSTCVSLYRVSDCVSPCGIFSSRSAWSSPPSPSSATPCPARRCWRCWCWWPPW